MKKLCVILMLFLCCLTYSQAAEKQYLFTHLDRENSGLSFDSIREMYRDSRGFLWVGTHKGLSRFDGVNFANFYSSDLGTDSDFINVIAEDESGNIWIGTDAGVVIYDYSHNSFRPLASLTPDHKAPGGRIYAMEKDSHGNIWIATMGEPLYKWEASTGKITAKKIPTSGNPYRIAIDLNDNLWIASYCDNIFFYDTASDKLRPIDLGPNSKMFLGDDVERLVYGPGNMLYVASKRRGLVAVNPQRHEASVICALEGDSRPINLAMEEGRYLWMSTTDGAVRYDLLENTSQKLVRDPSDRFSLSDNYITKVLPDNDGALWISTLYGGLNFYSPAHQRFVKYYRTAEGRPLDGCIVRDFAEDNQRRLWVSTERMGLFCLSQDGLKQYAGTDIPRNLTSICSDGDYLWIGSIQGISRLNLNKGTVQKYPSFVPGSDNRVVSIYQSLAGDIYVAATIGVLHYNRTSDEFNLLPGLEGITVENMEEDSRGILWLASYSRGVYTYDQKKEAVIHHYSPQSDHSGIPDMISSICVDAAGNPWVIGFSNGFFQYDKTSGRFTQYNKASLPKLPSDVFLTALTGPSGEIWLSTDSGLVRFDPSSGSVDVFSQSDGLLETEFRKGGIRLSDGSLAFGSTDGFIVFKPEDISKEVFHSSVIPYVQPSFWASGKGIALILLMAFSLAGIIVFTVLLFQRRKVRRRMAEYSRRKEQEMLDEKMTFFSNIIHEIKTPLTLIRTPLQKILSSGSYGADIKEDLSVISNSTDYMDKLVKEMLEFVRLEEHGYVLEETNLDYVELLDFVCFNFSETARDKNLSLKFTHTDKSLIAAGDRNALLKVFNNLIDNAVKYASSFINISLAKVNGQIEVRFENDGPHIPKSRRDDIFKPFVQYSAEKKPYSQSFGIGLALVRKLAELHGGSVKLDSEATNTLFVLTLPDRMAAQVASGESHEEDDSAPSNLPLLLVVEDNEELLSYLRKNLKSDFKVMTSTSAEKALSLLQKDKVDLLLTDIALQGMSGVELCRRMNTNPEYSHIPIVVLSAISSVKTKIKCMQNGASVYIEKPFSLDYLQACLKGLLEKRDTMKETYRPLPDVAQSINLPDRDEDFLSKLEQVVRKNLGDAKFTNCQLEEQLFISHSTLNRRMKALLNTTPNEYIRSKRLAAAATMLQNGGIRVNEVCYAVGFSSPSYFAKCFKAEYDMLPVEYAKMQKSSQKIEATDQQGM